MTKLKSKSAAVALIVCFYAEAVFSDAFSLLYCTAGKAAPLCALIGGAIATLMIFVASYVNRPAVGFIISALYTLIIIFRLASNTSYLYNGALTAYVLAGASVLAVIAAVKGVRGAGIYSALCYIPLIAVFVVCCLLGGTDFHIDYLNDFVSKGTHGFLWGIAIAFSTFAPAAICTLFIDKGVRRNALIASGISTVAVAVMLLLAVGVFGRTAEDYPSVIAELSKNVSVGKFFQRLEGFADASYIVCASVAVTALGAMMGDSMTCVQKKLPKIISIAVITVAFGTLSYIAVKNEEVNRTLLTISALAGFAVIPLMLSGLCKAKHITATVCALALFATFCGCTSSHEIENQTFVVITAFEDDTIHLITENGSGKNMYSAKTNSLSEAVNLIETTESVSISLLQAELLIVGDGADINSALMQSLDSDMPNSSSVMLMDGDVTALYERISEKYESAFEFVSAVQSGAEHSGYASPPASAVKASIEEMGSARIGVLCEDGISGLAIIKAAAD